VRDAEYWIAQLGLAPHPEGGWYRETYRAVGSIPAEALTASGHGGPRAFSTAIYYLLRSGEVSRLHRLKSDELLHFHAGAPLTLHLLGPQGGYRGAVLGPDPERGEALQFVVPAGCWFGATVEAPRTFSLVGCTVAPGFEFADFEHGCRETLLARYAEHRAIIERLTP
jgi:hypothetical protein